MAHINKNVSTMAMPSGMNRMGQFPLDMSSVYYDRASLEAYATSGAIAYVGQIVSLVDETNKKVTVYSIQNTEGLLKEVGTVPVGDGTSVVVDAEGKVALKGVSELVFERELEGGEKEEVQYQALMTKNGLVWVEPSKTTVEGLATLIEALTVRVKANEDDIDALQRAVGKAAEGEDVATGLFKAIADEIARATAAEEALDDRIDAIDFVDEDELATAIQEAKDYADGKFEAVEHPVLGVAAEDKVLALGADKLISATVALAYDSEAKAIKLTGKDGADLGSVDATPFIKDGMLNDVEYDADTNTLTFTWNTESGEKSDSVVLSDIIEPYTAGAGLKLEGNEFAVKVAEGNESFLTVGVDGLKLSGVQSAIDTAKSGAITDAEGKIATAKAEAIADAEGKIATAKQEAIDDAASKYATTGALSQLEVDLDARLDVLETYDHATYATKDELKATDDVAKDAQSRVGIVEGKIDEITSVGGEPNVVEKIKVNGVTLEVEKDAEGKSTKSVNIPVPTKFSEITDDSGFDARITAAQNQADKGVSDAAAAAQAASNAQSKADANAAAIGANNTAIELLQEKDQTHTSKIAALEQHDSDHTALYNTLNSTVAGHGTEIAGLKTGKADTTVTDGLASRITVNENAIKSLNETTLPLMNEEIGKKANAADVYTKTNIGVIAEGKTLVKMVEEAAAAGTDAANELANGAVKANTEAIAAIYTPASGDGENLVAASGVLVDLVKAERERAIGEEGRIAGLVNAEAERAVAAEEALGDRIDGIDALLNTISDKDNITSLKELALWVEEHGADAAEMSEAISNNANAIANIYTPASGEGDDAVAASGVLVRMLAEEATRANAYSDANLALAKAYSDTNLNTAKQYANEEIAKLHTVDANTIQLNENNKAYVAKVSVDVLDDTGIELVLFGGDARVSAQA